MENCIYFTPNRLNHPQFADALLDAKNSGVNIIAVNSIVTENELKINEFIQVVL